MRLILEIGYKHVVFAPTADVSAIIKSLEGARVCEKAGYGATEAYTADTEEIGVKIVRDADIRLPDTDKPEFVTALARQAKENQELHQKYYASQRELTEAKTKIARFESAVGPASAPVAAGVTHGEIPI